MENGFVLSVNAQRIAITNSHTAGSLALIKRSRAKAQASYEVRFRTRRLLIATVFVRHTPRFARSH